MDPEEAARALGLRLSRKQLDLLLLYRDLLIAWNRRVDLVAPSNPQDILRGHVLDSLLLLVVCEPARGGRVVDVGSGAGLPGLVWAVARPDLHLLLLEPRRKRAAFLERAMSELGLPNVEVEARTAEEAGKDPRWRGRFDLAVARAVAEPEEVLKVARDLLKVGGRLAVTVGPQYRVRPPFREASREVPWQPGMVRKVAVALV